MNKNKVSPYLCNLYRLMLNRQYEVISISKFSRVRSWRKIGLPDRHKDGYSIGLRKTEHGGLGGVAFYDTRFIYLYEQ